MYVGEIGPSNNISNTLYYALKEEDLKRIGCTETVSTFTELGIELQEGEIAVDMILSE